jgi:hypothetical protein
MEENPFGYKSFMAEGQLTWFVAKFLFIGSFPFLMGIPQN